MKKKQDTSRYQLEMVQQNHLINIFDLSPDYFNERKGSVFLEEVHFFPQSNSKTKKVILWDVKETKKALKSINKISFKFQNDPELEELLKRS